MIGDGLYLKKFKRERGWMACDDDDDDGICMYMDDVSR